MFMESKRMAGKIFKNSDLKLHNTTTSYTPDQEAQDELYQFADL